MHENPLIPFNHLIYILGCCMLRAQRTIGMRTETRKKNLYTFQEKSKKTLELKHCSALVLLNISLFKRNVFELVAQKMPYFIPM